MEVQFRDAYGFAVRPQHLQRYREYANIYKEEEEERSYRWETFLKRQEESDEMDFTTKEELDDAYVNITINGNTPLWNHTRPSLRAIARLMGDHINKRRNTSNNVGDAGENSSMVVSLEELTPLKGDFEEHEDGSCDLEIKDVTGGTHLDVSLESQEAIEAFESLVHGGLPMALRGELWQAFVGVNTRRVDGYYSNLLASETNKVIEESIDPLPCGTASELPSSTPKSVPEKWKAQIEKDLPRTFPGHPALDEDGRDALRRVLTAYARHNPSVGYCQAMNFFAGLLLLLMPEENAFWTLLCIIDDYFEGYYTEEMIDSQVDQLVFEDLMREKFPKLANHLDYLGVNIAWVTGPWFLSIFINMLPWESVLRVWDVLLFDGNRAILFRTALALMELYGPALVTTKDTGDAVTLLQSLAGSTFDSSQLVLTACMGYQVVDESKLQELRKKHRSAVTTALKEKLQDSSSPTSSRNLAKKLYSIKRDSGALMTGSMEEPGSVGSSNHQNLKNTLPMDVDFGMAGNKEVDSVDDLKEQVTWLKVQLCRILEDKRSAIQRAEELETALMEMVKQDNRRVLSLKVEQLDKEVAQLKKNLSDKQEQENATIQILIRMEQEQKATEDARVSAELDASAQRYAVQMLQEKYEEAVFLLAEMDKRAVMAETMLEATLQYQSIQVQVQATSPRTARKGQQSFQNKAPSEESLLSLELDFHDENMVQKEVPEEGRILHPMGKSGDIEESNDDSSTTNMSPKHNFEPEKHDLNMS